MRPTLALLFVSSIAQSQILATFQLSEHFGVAWPDQPIEFRYDGGQPNKTAALIGPAGVVVPYQWVASCSDKSATKGCIVVRSGLPANAQLKWTLKSSGGMTVPLMPVHPVQVGQVGSNFEVKNGLAGVRIVKPAGNPSPWNRAPIQGILLPNGTWTGAGSSPNLLYSQNQEYLGNLGAGNRTPIFFATGYNVTVLDAGPLKATIQATYTFNRPQYYAEQVVNPPGIGHYTITISMYANSKSVLIDEDTDMDFSYYLPLYAQLHPDQARWRGHDALSSAGYSDPGCGYEAAVPVTGAANTSPVLISAAYSLSNGQPVRIDGVQGNTSANGTFFAKTTGYPSGQFGLYADAALTVPVVGGGVYAGGGIVKPAYRGQNLGPTPDAFVDLTYTQDRPAGYFCGAGTPTGYWGYNRMMSNYYAASHSAPWYEMMYNSSAGPTAPVVGIFVGRSSLLVNSGIGSSMPGFYSSNQHWISGTQDAGIQVDTLLRGADARTCTMVHRNWGIWAGTVADLQPPSQHQPIADEQNSLAGINLSRLYTYQLDFPDPAGGWSLSYLSKSAAVQQISWVIDGTSVCGSKNCYYNLLYSSDPTPGGRAVLNMWQANNSQGVQTALDAILALATQLCQVLTAGDNRYDPAWGYYHIGLQTQDDLQVLIAILMDSNTTPTQMASAKAALALFGSILWDNDWFAIDNDPGDGVGLANQVEQYLQFRTNSVTTAPSQPYLATQLPTAITYTTADLAAWISSTGAAPASTHYQNAFFGPMLVNYEALSLQGFLSMTDPIWTAYANWELSIQTPPEPRFGNLRKGYSNGDGNTEADARTGMLATGLYSANPTVASQLMWAYQQAHPPSYLAYDGMDSPTFTIDPTIPSLQPQLASINIPGYHSVERHGFGTPNETVAWFINGDFYSSQGHRHADDGQVSIYAHAAPLAIDWNANLYYPSTGGRFMHDSIVYDTELSHPWNSDNAGLLDASILMSNATNTEFTKFGNSTSSTATFSAQDGTVWTRTVRTLAFNLSYPAIYVTDTFAGPSASAGKTLTWNMMAGGTVSTPAGPVTPISRFSSGCQSPAGALPSNGTVYSLNSGLQPFTFTGLSWPKHATGGINWDLFSLSGTGSQFFIGNWGHGCQSSGEESQYQQANQAPFAEIQDILRIHGSGPFTTLILPYRKTETPNRSVTQQSCGIQIVQGSEITCFNNSTAVYSNGTESILTTYDGSTQSAFGITVAGAPQEVVIQPAQIVWTISGVVAGTRSLTLPGNWYPNQPVSQSGNTFSYSFSGGAQTAPVTITFKQH